MTLKDTLLKWKYAVLGSIIFFMVYFCVLVLKPTNTNFEIWMMTIIFGALLGNVVSIYLNTSILSIKSVIIESVQTSFLIVFIAPILLIASTFLTANRLSQPSMTSPGNLTFAIFLVIPIFLLGSLIGTILGGLLTYSLKIKINSLR